MSAVLSLTWDENMPPTLITVEGLTNLELLREVQVLEKEYYDEEDDVTYLSARDIPKLLIAKGYKLTFLDMVEYDDHDDGASLYEAEVSVEEALYPNEE